MVTKELFFFLLIITVVTLSIGKYCEQIGPLYESFQCKQYCILKKQKKITKYDCSKSPYKANYVNDTYCYFNGSYYLDEQLLGKKYPGMVDGELCTYTCLISTDSRSGPYFKESDCVRGKVDPTYRECTYDVLTRTENFNKHFAPVFMPNSRCPYRWINIQPRNLTSDDCSENSKLCCKYRDYTLKRDREFNISTPAINFHCLCSCPPLVECTVLYPIADL